MYRYRNLHGPSYEPKYLLTIILLQVQVIQLDTTFASHLPAPIGYDPGTFLED